MKKSNECPICSGVMEEVIRLPNFPMTELYETYTDDFQAGRGLVDQSLLYCQDCSHGKLGTVVPPEILYSNYRTVTSKSVGASHSVNGFYRFIAENLDLSNYDTVIDIGANDSSLLAKFSDKKRVAVDPNASGDAEISIKTFIEDADLRMFKADKKLIVCSHTLEHLEKPEVLLEKIDSILCYGDSCAFQFPSLDYLVKDARIDQVHHQHVHYFSLRSISFLIAKHGFEITKVSFDDSHYGTLQIIFRRGLEELKGRQIKTQSILEASRDFSRWMDSFNASIRRLQDPIGFGAALMLPVLAYYAPEIYRLSSICDQDETKWGQRWVNLNLPITGVPGVRGRDVCVTAFNTKLAVRKIVNKLTSEGARNVCVPFGVL